MALFRQRLRDAECHTTRKDRDLVERVAVRENSGENRVATFVIRGGALLFDRQHQRVAARTHHDAVARRLEVDALDLRRTTTNREERRFVHQVGEIGTAHSGGSLRHHFEVDVGAHALVAAVHLEDGQTLFVLGKRHDDLAVEATRAQQRRVENVGAVGGRHDDDALGGLESVHLGQHLIERLLALVVAATETGSALAADRVDFVDEDDGAPHLACLLEQVAHAAGADADEHFHEVGTGDRQEADSGFTGHCAGEQRLAGTRGTDQQDALRDTGPDLLETLGHAQEVDDFFDLGLHALVSGDISERRGRTIGGVRLGAATSDGHHVAHLARGPTVHPHEEADDEEERQQQWNEAHEPVRLRRVGLEVDTFGAQQLAVDFVGETRRCGGGELAAIDERSGDAERGVVEFHLVDATGLDLGDELFEADLLAVRAGKELWSEDE